MTLFKQVRALWKRNFFLWTGLVAAACSSALLGALTFAGLTGVRSLSRELEEPVFLCTLVAYALLLAGLRNRWPLTLSFAAVFLVGWTGEPWLHTLFPDCPPGFLDILPDNPAGRYGQPLWLAVAPLLALESLRREAPDRRSTKCFRHAQVTEAMSCLSMFCAEHSGDGQTSAYLWALSFALFLCALGQATVGCVLSLIPDRRPGKNKLTDLPSSFW